MDPRQRKPTRVPLGSLRSHSLRPTPRPRPRRRRRRPATATCPVPWTRPTAECPAPPPPRTPSAPPLPRPPTAPVPGCVPPSQPCRGRILGHAGHVQASNQFCQLHKGTLLDRSVLPERRATRAHAVPHTPRHHAGGRQRLRPPGTAAPPPAFRPRRRLELWFVLHVALPRAGRVPALRRHDTAGGRLLSRAGLRRAKGFECSGGGRGSRNADTRHKH